MFGFDAMLAEFASILVLAMGGVNLSKSAGNPKEAPLASHSLKTDVSDTESTHSWGIKLRDSVSLLDRQKDFA